MPKKILALTTIVLFLNACSNLPVDEKTEKPTEETNLETQTVIDTPEETSENKELPTDVSTDTPGGLKLADWLFLENEGGTKHYLDAEGKAYDFPGDIDSMLQWGSPEKENFFKFTSDYKQLIYFNLPKVEIYDLTTRSSTTLMSVYSDYTDISSFRLSPDENSIAFIVVNNPAVHPDYPSGSKLFILTLKDGQLDQKMKYDISPVWDDLCPDQGCEPLRFEFLDNHTLHYYESTVGDTFAAWPDYPDTVEKVIKF